MEKTHNKEPVEISRQGSAEGRTWLNLRMVEVFVAVIQEDGMTNAASRLRMTQSAVSQAISSIESGLGVQLLERSVRPMQLTLFGQKFYARALELLRYARELEDVVQLQANDKLPLLRIGMSDSFASTAGPYVLQGIAPLASRWLVASGVDETSARALDEQRVDLIITAEEIEPRHDLAIFPVLREPLFIVAPRGTKKAGRGLAELGEHLPLIRYSANAFLRRHVESYLQQHDISLPRLYELDTSDAVLAMVRAGLGWTITTPLCVLKTQAALDDFQCLPLDPPSAPRTLRLVAYHGHHSALWEQIAGIVREIVRDQWTPRIRQLAPWCDVDSVTL